MTGMHRRRALGRWQWPALAAGSAIALLAVAGIANSQRRSDTPATPPVSATVANTDAGINERDPLVFTYFFYWYDAQTGAHLDRNAGLPVHLPADPPPSWRSTAWFSKELADMAAAGIDVALPVYWGTAEQWSYEGLPVLAQAKRELEEAGRLAPDIGLFFDTTILDGKDLTQPESKSYLYENIAEFFRRIPRDQWAEIDGRPVIWLYFAFFARAFDQGTFDHVYRSFEAEFGVRPYIIREMTWDFAKDAGSGAIDPSRPIATEANFKWGAALDGFLNRTSVAEVGPGFDERQIPGRGDAHRDRVDGKWYVYNFLKAIESGKRFVVIETWNEIHEASGVGETLEWSRRYIELTRQLVDRLKATHANAADD